MLESDCGCWKVTDVFPSLWACLSISGSVVTSHCPQKLVRLPWSTEDRESTFNDGGTVRDAKQGGCHKVEKRGLSGLHQESRRNGVLRRFFKLSGSH